MNSLLRNIILLIGLGCFPAKGFAQSIVPDGTGTVIIPQGNQLQIRGGTAAGTNLFHSFDRFNLEANETATFFTNPIIQNILGRVTSGEASRINGLLQVQGNANLILMNPAGILFGSTARLDIPASFTATTAQRIGLGNRGFNVFGINDYATLTEIPSRFEALTGGIFNAGNLAAGQSLSLFGGSVLNVGSLKAQKISIAATPHVRVTAQGDLLSLDLPRSEISSKPLPELLTGGDLQNATQATLEDGIPTLTQAGTAIVSGQISSPTMQIAGNRIGLIDANLTGEQIRIGGDRQGIGEFPRSQFLFGNLGTQIQGNNVILWSDQATRFAGTITTQPQGFIETSSKQFLDVSQAKINAAGGTWLLDPSDINIVTGGTGTLTAGVFDPPSAIANIDPAIIEAALNNGTNVTITTTNGIGSLGDISLSSSIHQIGTLAATLTLTGRRFNQFNNSTIDLNSTSTLTFNLNQVNPEGFSSLRLIQNAINAIGTITITPQINLGAATYITSGTPVSINKNVVINGAGSPTTTLTGDNLSRVILVQPGANVTIRDVSIADGATAINESGGAILNAGNLSLIDVGVRNSKAELNGGNIAVIGAGARLSMFNSFIADGKAQVGGGVFSDVGTVVDIINSYIGGNSAIEGGGISNFGTLSVSRSMFEANSSSFAGGGIRNHGITTVQDSTFKDGTGNYGGGISNVTNSSLTVFGSLLTNNVANFNGGAIATDGTATIEQTELRNNRAIAGVGGAIGNTGILNVQGASFLNNSTGGNAGNAGGAIASFSDFNSTPQVSIANSDFNQNRSPYGGAIRTSSETLLNVQGSGFQKNQAVNLGGAILANGVANITTTLFQENTALGTALSGGGAIYVQGTASRLNLSNSALLKNEASIGGAIDSFFPQAITIDSSLIQGNIARTEAGAILSDRNSVLTITNSEILNNQSTQDGGALYISGQGRIENTSIRRNVSTNGNGGGIYGIGDITIHNSNLVGNSAQSGGGFYLRPRQTTDAGNATITRTTIANNISTATDIAGGLSIKGQLNLSNSTLSGNTGGLFVETGTATIQSSTIAKNSAIGIFNRAGTVSLGNTIVAENPGISDVSGLFDDLGNNLIGISDGSTGFTISPLVGTRSNPILAGLAPLSNNGGFGETHALLPTSPALNAGNNAGVASLDQTGRARIQNSTIDIGAFESPLLSPIPPVLPSVPPVLPPVPPSTPPAPEPSAPTTQPPERSITSPILQPKTEASTVIDLERSLSNEYMSYYGLKLPELTTMQDIQETLAKVQQQKQTRSAIIYSIFVPSVITPAPNTGEVLTDQSEPITPLLRSQLKQNDDRLDLILVTATGKAIRYSTSATRAQIAQQAKLYRLAVSDVEDELSYVALSKQLYGWLVKPLEAELERQGIQGLIYCLDEGLRTAPIAAMSGDRGFVVDRYMVSVIPSVTLLNRELHALRDHTALAMGADAFRDLEPLPAVATELKLVTEQFWQGARFLNQNFTLDRLLQEKQSRSAGILHLATHAKFNPGKPAQSFIQLWDRPIQLDQMTSIAWATPPLHLLVLSACETAIDSTDAELGFTGLAAATGVHSVMGSLWAVSDVGTLALMSEFYIQLQQAPTRAEALRRAQIALRNGTVRIENNTLITSKNRVPLPPNLEVSESSRSFQHPFYWAAFTLVGNPW